MTSVKSKDGPLVRYYDNGQVEYEGNFKDGERDGLYVTYHENGQLWYKGNFKDGKLDGPLVRGQLQGR
jgi:antitoxin component YwqK of YwqJK toxin-antitoxin module